MFGGSGSELSHRTFVLGSRSVAAETDAERIKRLQILCDQLEALRKQVCKAVTMEIRVARAAGQRERRVKTRKVKTERRQKV